MNNTKTHEYPKNIENIYQKAIFYEKLTIVYLCLLIIILYFTMSNSQAMKTVWVDSMLSLIPPISFLISSFYIKKPATKKFPYGFHKVPGISFWASGLALFVVGLFLLYEGVSVLITKEHPSISLIFIGEFSVWLGYLMILALFFQAIPSWILGNIKLKLSKKLYDKILFSDSKMNKADWMSGFGSILGIILIGAGIWWSDAVIAILISIDITYDGFKQLKQSTLDLIDEVPRTIQGNATEPVINQVKQIIRQASWVEYFEIRFRDEGHVFFGDIFIIPNTQTNLINNIQDLRHQINSLDWRIHDIVIMPMKRKDFNK